MPGNAPLPSRFFVPVVIFGVFIAAQAVIWTIHLVLVGDWLRAICFSLGVPVGGALSYAGAKRLMRK
ncbi:hypothetical protein [Actinomadura chokoriensis]|uniref:DUF2530 domain-containing protein n=2 Tax=Actinomadura chokoriensis TaxID=454156 RepID=A0ABV4QZ76_9ACTN